MKFGARTLMMFTTKKKAKAPGTDRRKTERTWRHVYGLNRIFSS